ncbi:MAG: phytanoyl-CoA dioxygenase family protein [Armatimonadetes bacterium]|nr:phytanoyl-CoA dioxygenase family protein [Armatimonadota bacterium]
MPSSSKEQARTAYERNGFYLVQEPIFPDELLRRAVDGMEAIRRGEYDTGLPPQPSPWNPGDDPNTLCKIEQPQFASHAIRELLRYPALGEWAAALTGASMVQAWWVQLLVKPSTADPEKKTNIGWHQDRHYWGIWEDGSELFTAWIALSDVTEESGPMRFLRGSHKLGYRQQGDFYEQDLEAQREGLRLPESEAVEEVAAILPPGGVSFHDRLTFHGSGPNRSGSPRRSLAVHLRTQNSRPVEDKRAGLAQFIDDPELCPFIYGE